MKVILKPTSGGNVMPCVSDADSNRVDTFRDIFGSSLTLSEAVQYNAYNDKRQTYTLSVSHGGTASATMVYNYDSLGRASSVSRPLPPSVIGNVSYSYNMHGWLKGIATNSFREELYYADGLGTPCYNGNVSTMKWSNAGYPQKRGYRFAYDSANRLSSALYGEREALDNKTGRYDEVLLYDANGNVRHLERRGLKQNGVFGKIDNLNLAYGGNHLVSVEEDALELLYSGSFDYKGSCGSYYQYNGNGSFRLIDELRSDNNERAGRDCCKKAIESICRFSFATGR